MLSVICYRWCWWCDLPCCWHSLLLPKTTCLIWKTCVLYRLLLWWSFSLHNVVYSFKTDMFDATKHVLRGCCCRRLLLDIVVDCHFFSLCWCISLSLFVMTLACLCLKTNLFDISKHVVVVVIFFSLISLLIDIFPCVDIFLCCFLWYFSLFDIYLSYSVIVSELIITFVVFF